MKGKTKKHEKKEKANIRNNITKKIIKLNEYCKKELKERHRQSGEGKS